MGPTPLPIEVSVLTLIENALPVSYELRSHSRRLDLLDPSPALVDTLVRLCLPAGVNIAIKS
jgi:small subunit ribosomal protein S10